MLFLAAIIASLTSQQARASVHIVKAQRATPEEWERSRLKREVIVCDHGRELTVRLIEFE